MIFFFVRIDLFLKSLKVLREADGVSQRKGGNVRDDVIILVVGGFCYNCLLLESKAQTWKCAIYSEIYSQAICSAVQFNAESLVSFLKFLAF